MVIEELEKLVEEKVNEAMAQKLLEITRYNEKLERRIETLATEIRILKEGGNL